MLNKNSDINLKISNSQFYLDFPSDATNNISSEDEPDKNSHINYSFKVKLEDYGAVME